MQQAKTNIVNSFIWSAIQRFGSRILLFIANIVLARLLSPADFGCVGIIMVFISFSDIFINGGFASALIQKKDTTQTDYSSVFFVNMSVSLLCYAVLFFWAPSIAEFYHIPILCEVLRAQGIVLIFNAFNVVQTNMLQKRLNFKRLAIAENVSCVLGCGVGIFSAYMGMEVWSLVIKNLVMYFSYSLILWLWDSWRPSFAFSFKSVSELFQFGGFILLSNLTDAIYNNLQPLIIGRVFSDRDLGHFTQARKLEELPVIGLSNVVSSVSFPLYSKLQDDKQGLLTMLQRNIKAITYLNFPLMVLLAIVAEPLMVLLFGEKWLPAVPYFQILCVAGLLTSINISNRDLFAALGRSRVYFYSQLVYKIVGIALIVGGMHWGIEGLIWGRVVAYYFLFVLNAAIANRLIGYGLWLQLRDVLPNLLLSLLSSVPTYLIALRVQHLGAFGQTLCIGSTYAVLYLLLSVLSRNASFILFWRLGMNYAGRFLPRLNKGKND